MQRGAALLLVLWLVAMLAALVGAFAMIAQVEHMQGQVLLRGVVARQAARAGLEYAMTRLGGQDPRLAWIPDGRTYEWTYRDARIDLVATDEQGKVDLNLADHPLLSRLFQATGSEPRDADGIAAAVLDWRDPDPLTQPVGSAEDMLDILGNADIAAYRHCLAALGVDFGAHRLGGRDVAGVVHHHAIAT